jgi:hypothetical protein
MFKPFPKAVESNANSDSGIAVASGEIKQREKRWQ